MQQWQKIVAAAGGAVALGAVLFFLLREDAEADASAVPALNQNEKQVGKTGKKLTLEELLELMKEMIEAQSATKTKLRNLVTTDLADKDFTFSQIYARVKEVVGQDPLKSRGMTPDSFEENLEKYQNEPAVRAAIETLMMPKPSVSAKEVSVDDIVKVHKLMVEELEAFIKDFDSQPDKSSYDMQMVVQTSQVVASIKVYKRFKLTDNDIEHSIMTNQAAIMQNPEFIQAYTAMQATMEKFLRANGGMGPQP